MAGRMAVAATPEDAGKAGDPEPPSPQCSLTAAPSLSRLSERFAVSRRRQ